MPSGRSSIRLRLSRTIPDPRPGGRIRKKLDEKGLAFLETLAYSEPPQGQKRWAMQLATHAPFFDRFPSLCYNQQCLLNGLSKTVMPMPSSQQHGLIIRSIALLITIIIEEAWPAGRG